MQEGNLNLHCFSFLWYAYLAAFNLVCPHPFFAVFSLPHRFLGFDKEQAVLTGSGKNRLLLLEKGGKRTTPPFPKLNQKILKSGKCLYWGCLFKISKRKKIQNYWATDYSFKTTSLWKIAATCYQNMYLFILMNPFGKKLQLFIFIQVNTYICEGKWILWHS